MKPADLAQEQLDAYNARDLPRFLACFADDVQSFRLPTMQLVLDGKPAFSDFYARERFSHSGLRAELLGRTVVGDMVIDHERIHGIAAEPVEMGLILVVRNGLIARTFAIPAKT